MFKFGLHIRLCQFWIYKSNQPHWELQMEKMLSVLHEDDCEIISDKKSGQSKVWIANMLKRKISSTTPMCGSRLNLTWDHPVCLHA